MLSDEQLKYITKGGRQSLFWSKKIAEAQERETLFHERLKIVNYLERNLFPNDNQSNDTLIQIRQQILNGTYIDLDKVD